MILYRRTRESFLELMSSVASRNRIAKTFGSGWYESPRFGSGTRRGQSKDVERAFPIELYPNTPKGPIIITVYFYLVYWKDNCVTDFGNQYQDQAWCDPTSLASVVTMALVSWVIGFVAPGKQMRTRSSRSLVLMKTADNLSPLSSDLKSYILRRSLFWLHRSVTNGGTSLIIGLLNNHSRWFLWPWNTLIIMNPCISS